MKNPEEAGLARGGPNLPCRRLPGTADQAQWALQMWESQQRGGDFAIRPVDQSIEPIVHHALHSACLERPRTAARHLSTCVLALTNISGDSAKPAAVSWDPQTLWPAPAQDGGETRDGPFRKHREPVLLQGLNANCCGIARRQYCHL